MDALKLFQQIWPYAIVAAPGIFAAWQSWRNGQRDLRKDRTDLVKIAQEAAGSVIHDLRLEAHRLRERLDEVEAEFNTFRRAHDGMIADRDAELVLLRGENRQLKAENHSLYELLDRAGIPRPTQSKTYWQVTDAGLTPIDLGTPTNPER